MSDGRWYVVPMVSDRYFDGVIYREVFASNKTSARRMANGETIPGVYVKGKIVEKSPNMC